MRLKRYKNNIKNSYALQYCNIKQIFLLWFQKKIAILIIFIYIFKQRKKENKAYYLLIE